MITSDDVVKRARECLETPFHHQGRLKGVGMDCLGLVLYAYGPDVPYDDPRNYPMTPDGYVIRPTLEKLMIKVNKNNMRHGDLLWMRVLHFTRHFAIYTKDNTIIHAHFDSGMVVEHILDEKWRKRIIEVYRHPELING